MLAELAWFCALVNDHAPRNIWQHKLHWVGFKKKMRQSQEVVLDLGGIWLGKEGEYKQNALCKPSRNYI